MSSTLEIYLCIFITILSVIFIMLSVFVIKLFIELSQLINNFNDITTVIKSDLEPTIKELQQSLKNINAIITSANKNVSDLKSIVMKITGAGAFALTSIKGITGGFFQGLKTGMKIFKK